MPAQVVDRPIAGTLRCAACHAELLDRRFTCGCSCTVTVRRRDATPAEPAQRGLVFHLVWLVPGLLSFLWPVWLYQLDVNSPVAFACSLLLGPAVGHCCLAPFAGANDDPGSPHARALIAEIAGISMGFGAVGPLLFALFLRWAKIA